jgi:Zn-dependent peptidase ImmA (M78 family)/transcriptional regulator with XRE-family HTH domain
MNNNTLPSLNPTLVGKQLQYARERRGMTQEQAAKLIKVSRTTMVAIEKGERRIKGMELIILADAYGLAVSDLTLERPNVESFDVQFRRALNKKPNDAVEVQTAINELAELCRDYVDLERIMDAPLPRQYPPEYKIQGLPVDRAAERVAQEERQRLGLGDGPVGAIRDILENEVGIRIFYLAIKPASYSEIYHFDNDLGACMAINILHPENRRRWSLGHAYAHFIAHRYKPSVSALDQYRRKPESERFADAFAMFFFLPTTGLLRRVSEIKASSDRFKIGDLFSLACYYGVSPQTLCLRLEELELVPNATWERLKDKGLKVRKIEEELGIVGDKSPAERLPRYYQHLAIEALDQGKITEGRFARFMRLDRIMARAAAEKLRQGSSGVTNPELGNIDLFNL